MVYSLTWVRSLRKSEGSAGWLTAQTRYSSCVTDCVLLSSVTVLLLCLSRDDKISSTNNSTLMLDMSCTASYTASAALTTLLITQSQSQCILHSKQLKTLEFSSFTTICMTQSLPQFKLMCFKATMINYIQVKRIHNNFNRAYWSACWLEFNATFNIIVICAFKGIIYCENSILTNVNFEQNISFFKKCNIKNIY